MSEISLAKGSAMSSPRLAVARVRTLLTELNLHLAGVAVLLLVCIYLLVHLFFDWRTISVNNASALQAQTAQMRAADVAAEPLRGLDEKVTKATEQADKFSLQRLPYADSEIVGELGALAKHENVRLTRTQYVYAPVLAGTAHELTQVRMDVNLSGDYRPLVHVLNALERDKMFFLIESMTLTGQQSGTVNLRLRLTTYQRPALQGEMSKAIDLGGEYTAPAPMPRPVQPVRPPAAERPFSAPPVQQMPPPVQQTQQPPVQPRPAPIRNSSGATPLPRLIPGQRGLAIPGQRQGGVQQGTPQPGGTQP